MQPPSPSGGGCRRSGGVVCYRVPPTERATFRDFCVFRGSPRGFVLNN
ncbi:MAG: hypothetical protein FWH14_08645 [Oscillospiraceae bacterium]|nr:hypothetical protein [Oscillospiraceae bacterium]